MTETTGESTERPRVTVAMPARNVARWLADAIESVLPQEGVEVELVVVDDASTDRTLEIARSYVGDGVAVLANPTHRGIGHSHNRVLAEASSPFIAHVDADDVIEPGALATLVAALGTDETVGQAYCDFFPIGPDGDIDPALRDRWRAAFARARRAPIDHRRELVRHGMVVSALRTYRRTVFDVVGTFDEQLPWAVDYDMALRVAEHFDFMHVPHLLYGRRIRPEGASQGVRGGPLAHWRMRSRLVGRRLTAGGGRLYGRGRLATRALLARGLIDAVRGMAGPRSGP